MKAILEPFVHIFNTVTDHVESEAISRVELQANTQGWPANVPVYTVYSRGDDGLSQIWARGTAAMPRNAAPKVQRALQKLYLCDMATYSMLPYIKQAVQKVHGRADGIIISNVVPRMLLLYPHMGRVVCEHSVCIIASASGEQYIADFTLEQFGFDPDMWLMKRSDYHDLVCSGLSGVCIDEEWYADMERLTSDVQNEPLLYNICQATRRACGVVGTTSFEKLRGSEQVDWVRDRAIEAVLCYD